MEPARLSDNLVLAHLKRLRAGLYGRREDVRDIKRRLTGLELHVSNCAATAASHYAGLALRMDRTAG